MLRGVQEQLGVDRHRGSYAQALPGAVVDFISNRIQLLLAVARQVGALRQILPHQAIHVLVGASLPGAVRVTEVHRDARCFGQLLVPGHFSALVVRHALAHGYCNAQQLVRKRLEHVGRTGRLGVWQFDQHDQPAGTFDQGSHCAGVAFTLDEVTFPVPWKLPVFNLGRANVNAQHVRDLASSVQSFAAGHTLVVGMSQASYQLALEFTHRLGIDAVVDGFG